MAGSVKKFVDRMIYWCTEGNLGYDQSQRWNLFVGGEVDCSSLVIGAAREAGFTTGSATYTGNMSAAFTANGWSRIANNGNPQYGDILLNDTHHVAVYIGNGKLAQASIDERGRASGGKTGDQANETNVKAYYNYPWTCYLRYTGDQSTTYTSPTDYNPNRYSTAYVKNIQTLLVAAGYRIGSSGIDGILGADTFNAVKDFQKANGLDVDGIPGPNTLAKLKGASSASSAKTYRNIRALQAAVGAVQDNVAGRDTRKRIDAVRKASRWGGMTFPYGVAYTQGVVGTAQDSVWGTKSKAAHDTTVKEIQAAVGAFRDGIWGVGTDTKVNDALNAAEHP